MKRDLLPAGLNWYRANLHCHTTLSDGKKTPEQIKDLYLSHGYSVVAFTDHDRYYCHNDLTDGRFLALNGFELEYYHTPWRGQTCHVCFIAPTDRTEALGWSQPGEPIFIRELPAGGLDPEAGGQLYRVSCPGRKYTPEYINADIRAAKDMGFFVTYNHPTWSLEHYPQYSRYEGMDAMEMSNYGCVAGGYDEDDGRVYDDLLSQGKRLYTIATDDNHNLFPDDGPYTDSAGCWTMIAAGRLDYESVFAALRRGDFYCCARVNPARGDCPQIKALRLEDDHVHIETTPASNILLVTDVRPGTRAIAPADGTITEADLSLKDAHYFRLVITGPTGNKTYTNAYWR
jgi:hypothetical protein